MDSPKDLNKQLSGADIPSMDGLSSEKVATSLHHASKDEAGRLQPWRKILEDVADHHESNEDNDFFTCSHGFYTQSVAA